MDLLVELELLLSNVSLIGNDLCDLKSLYLGFMLWVNELNLIS